jgi:hypothetical protein
MYAETYSVWIKNLFRDSFLVSGVPAATESEGPGRFGIEPGLPNAYYLFKKVILAETAVAGLEYHVCQKDLSRILTAGRFRLEREPSNRFDRYAVRVCSSGGRKIGYVPRYASRLVAGELDHGRRVFVRLHRTDPVENRISMQLYTIKPSILNSG